MSAVVPQILVGVAPVGGVTLGPFTRAYRQMQVENAEGVLSANTNNLTVTWNGAGGLLTLAPRAVRGYAFSGGVTTVTLAGAPSDCAYQLVLEG